MKNIITQLVQKTITLMAIFPLAFPISLPITQIIPSAASVQTEVKNEKVEKIAQVTFDQKNPEILVVTQKQVALKISESTVDRDERLAKESRKNVASSRNVVSRERVRTSTTPVDPNLSQKRQLVKAAAAQYGISWRVLEAVWQVETGKSWDTGVRSSAGATGPMQFLPSTFRHYSNGDITSANDSVYAAAKLLASSGASSGNIDQALFSYNHSSAYVAKVKRIADSISE